MNRRYFFKQLASGLVAATAPGLFLPKAIKPEWKAKFQICGFETQIILADLLEEYRRHLEAAAPMFK